MNPKTEATTIDEALEFLRDTGPEYGSGLSNHGPMLADALISLEKSSLVMPWLEQYKKHLGPSPASSNKPVSGYDYQSALGHIDRFGDWQAFFRSQVKEGNWKQVLNTWVSNLSPGFIAAAMHGIIRVGHAVRSLSNIETENTLNELADGFSYWAARYQTLPEAAPNSQNASCSIYGALKNISPLPEAQRETLGLISEEVDAVGKMAAFPEIINLLGQGDQPDKVLSNLTEGFAHMFVYNAEPSQNVIAVVHAVTGPYALRHMLPYLEEPVAKKALRYAWQASAALYMRYGIACPAEESQHTPMSSQSELIEKAVATGDEHAVKFVEACITEHKLNPNSVYLSAAAICCKLLR